MAAEASGAWALIRRHPWPAAYCLWAGLSTALALSAGLTAENSTRLAVIGFLFFLLLTRNLWCKAVSGLAPRRRFILLGLLLACVVEGFHMISTPVFLSLRIGPQTPPLQALQNYALDLAYTLPAYVLIFGLIWHLINRWPYPLWPYVLIMGLGQTLGDGGIFYFLAAPWMLPFLPYPMSNYHAINILPFLAVRHDLPAHRPAGARILLAIPALILTYLFCGALIRIVGKMFGLE